VAGAAGILTDPLPGVDRFVRQLARIGVPAVPCGISENRRFVIRFGKLVTASELREAPDAARHLMQRIGELL
jgi:hypothetical protein